MASMRVLLAITFGLFAAGIAIGGTRLHWPTLSRSPAQQAVEWWHGWQADRTAVAFLRAVQRSDSGELANLSRSGTGHSFLCARRVYPIAYWQPATNRPLMRLGLQDGYWRYRLRGQRLSEDSTIATVDFFIHPDTAQRVAKFMMTTGSGIQNLALQSCLAP
jgi:hypothetical protein